jgi:hypothetical protein
VESFGGAVPGAVIADADTCSIGGSLTGAFRTIVRPFAGPSVMISGRAADV